ncbi:hypothetical protein BDN72DRAFT_847669 [Pluteus cervinus]|uniref:Uncharacterized protein n=1 Tax=Pluteus cervinus TaxID=181527 RepID=A0ACD3ACM0_9AGAR|nr:hypothetical protein BDN72DRAFT_847669 [Pluteus cervinus]
MATSITQARAQTKNTANDVALRSSEEITDIARTVRDIRNRFEQVSSDLKSFDDRHLKKADDLRSTWDGYYEEYKTLLRDSHKDALNLKLICDEYLETLLPALEEDDIEAEELEGIATDYKQKTTPQEKTSHPYAKALDALSSNLTNFRTTIGSALAEAKAGIDAQISSLEGQVEKLKEVIREQQDLVNAALKKVAEIEAARASLSSGIPKKSSQSKPKERNLVSAILTKVTDIGASVASAPPPSADAPTEAAAAAAAAAVVDAKGQLKDSEEKLASLESQIAGLKAEQQAFPELEKILEACDNKIGSISLKVGTFGDLWIAVNTDANHTTTKLQSGTDDKIALRRELKERDVTSLYTALQQALTHYAFEANV